MHMQKSELKCFLLRGGRSKKFKRNENRKYQEKGAKYYYTLRK